MAPSFFSIPSIILLGALSSLVYAEPASSLGKRAALSPRQNCRNPSWIAVCPGAFPCIPPGGICCSDGITYVMPPETCPDGTEPVATAVVSNVVTTPAPVPTPPPTVEFTWYTWTITYYYYYYYYTYFAASYELTSTETTYYTTVSLTATNDAAASSLFTSLSASLSSNIPTQTGTPTVGSVAPETSTPAATAPSYPTGNYTVPSSSLPPEFTGAAASLRTGTMSSFGNVFVFAAGAFAAIPGVLMVWL